jgi:hypothetical protein
VPSSEHFISLAKNLTSIAIGMLKVWRHGIAHDRIAAVIHQMPTSSQHVRKSNAGKSIIAERFSLNYDLLKSWPRQTNADRITPSRSSRLMQTCADLESGDDSWLPNVQTRDVPEIIPENFQNIVLQPEKFVGRDG